MQAAGLLQHGERIARARAATVCGLLLGAAALLPARRPLPLDLCLFNRLTGAPCLTCGLTRSVCLFVQGSWGESLRMHPAGPLCAAALVAGAVWAASEAALGRTLAAAHRRRLGRAALAIGGLASAAVWIGRLSGRLPAL